jgi:hypothetical protein
MNGRSVARVAVAVVVFFLFSPLLHAAITGTPVIPVVSPPLKSLAPLPSKAEVPHLVPNQEKPRRTAGVGATPADPVVQQATTAHSPDFIGLNFDGAGVSNSAPPDTTGRVGRNHYVQWVNTMLSIYDKQGNRLYGPVKGNTLFQSLGGTCATHNDGDPLVEYDILADRWMLTQFAVYATDGSFSHQCVAVSMTGDPLGSYYLYDFRTSTQTDPALFVDYPHSGVWPDGYYITTHQFPDVDPGGQGLYVFDRVSMLAGLPATYQFYNFGESVPGALVYWGALPADLDSLTPPPPGAPETIVAFGSPDSTGVPNFVLHTWKVKATWGSSPSLQVSGPFNVPVAPFNAELCTHTLGTYVATQTRPCVPQPIPVVADGSTPYTPNDIWLDGVSDRLMFRAAYRNYGDHESLVVNHTVNSGAYQAGVRWYELRGVSTTPTLFQQSTFVGNSNDPTQNRWMGSVAQDNAGNMLLGYTKSSPTLLPEIDVAGRLANDAAGQLGPEILMKASGGSQISTGNRWGDYSTMTVDPYDGCTFWYSAEYIPENGQFNWKTRIGTFRYSACSAPQQGRIEGTVTDCATGAPMSHATVTTDNGFSGATDDSGRYSIIVPPGNYTITASAPNRSCAPSSSASVSVANGTTSSRNFCLTGSPKLIFVSSAIDDSSGSGNGAVNKDECVKLSVVVANVGCGVGTGVTGTLSTSTPGVTVGAPKSSFGTIARDAQGNSATPFSFSTSSANGFKCGVPIDFTLALGSDQSPSVAHFSIPTCQAASIAKSGAITASDAQQNARLGRDSNSASCAAPKACPASLGTGTRGFDAYTFSNQSDVTTCVTVNVTADASCNGANQIFSAAYLDSYDPQNLCTNYLADEGSSPDLGYHDYSFEVPAGRTFVVVVDAVSEGGTCSNYNIAVSGLVDNATAGSGACPIPPVVSCVEDTDPQIAYSGGWHLVNDTGASGGHFRMNSGAQPLAATFAFTVPSGGTGALTYNYAKSAKGGSADVYVDGAFRESISYVSASGSARAPQFGFTSRYTGLAAGNHTLELRNMKGTAYIDGFCLESAFSNAQPTSGPGQTTTSSGNAGVGGSLLQNVAVPPGATSLDVVAETTPNVPLQLVVIAPNGVTLSSASATNGLATISVPASTAGMYVVKSVNLSAGPVSIWTAATPQVNR